MAVGYQVNNTLSSLNTQLGQAAVDLQNAANEALALFGNVNNLGTTGLEALGFSATDAANFLLYAGYLNTMAELYFGQATQATAFDYDSGLIPARGGQ